MRTIQQQNQDSKTTQAMAAALARLAEAGPVEAHHLAAAGFQPADIARLGDRAIDLAASMRPDLHHPGNATHPKYTGPSGGPSGDPTHGVRRSGVRRSGVRQSGARPARVAS